jgi:ABC-type sugar transport system permease subunit
MTATSARPPDPGLGPGTPGPSRTPRSTLGRREAAWAMLFISPWIVGFLAFTFIPMIATFAFTFTNISLAQPEPIRFVGLDNWATLVGDPQVWQSLSITLRFALLMVPIGVLTPLAVALLLNSPSLRASSLFRILFFVPYVVPFVASVLIWNQMLNPSGGWVAVVLSWFGVQSPNFLQDTAWIYPGLAFIGIWAIGGGVIVYLAGLRGIPTELYDAAKIDGAGSWAQLRHVTLPLLTPVIFYTLVLGIVDILQYFLGPLVLNQGTGEPGGTTNFLNLYIYKNFFAYQNMSYGATLAWLLFAITLVITGVVFGTARRWVYYAGER